MLMQNKVLWKKLEVKSTGNRLLGEIGSMAVITVDNSAYQHFGQQMSKLLIRGRGLLSTIQELVKSKKPARGVSKQDGGLSHQRSA